ncbi:tyrosine-type recombinase/integrase [Candidatus Woesearchaeota archaeon]|nr:tyrosine-type recombinase/integrase [Candidatus Woesearchaeota archaeon]
MTVKEVSSFLNVHPKTVYKWTEERKIPFIRVNGLIRFKKKQIEDLNNHRDFSFSEQAFLQSKFMIPLPEYDKMLLKGRSALSSRSSKRWYYGFGKVYTRKTKQGKIRYYIEYTGRDGRRKREVVRKAQTRSEAVLVLQKKAAESFDSEHSNPRPKEISFQEFSTLYLENYSKINKKSWKCDDYALNAHLIPYFGQFKLNDITPLLIERYRAERLETGVKKSSTNRELALLKKMFNLAIDWDYVRDNPVKKVKLFSEKDNLKERVLSQKEEIRLLEETADHLSPIVLTALNTGMRRNEILNLTWVHVQLKQRIIHVTKTKSGKNRVVPINDVVYEILKEKQKHSKSEYVFVNPETGKPFKSIRHSFENACRRAGIKNLRFHDLRHTFACRMIEKGCDIETLRDLLGHHSITVTQRYIHTTLDRKRQAVELLSAQNGADLSHICHMDERETKDRSSIPLFTVN